MLKKVFEAMLTFVMWVTMQIVTFIIGYLGSALIYEAVDDWMSEEWVLGAFFVALNTGMMLYKMWKRRIKK